MIRRWYHDDIFNEKVKAVYIEEERKYAIEKIKALKITKGVPQSTATANSGSVGCLIFIIFVIIVFVYFFSNL